MVLATRDDDFKLFRYTPSLPAAIIFVAIFGISSFLHVFQAMRKRTLYFVPFIVGGFFEVVGYVGRALCHTNTNSLGLYIMQTLLLLVAPALFAASIYMTLGRLITFTHGERHAPIRANWLTKIFVCGDVLSFIVQSGGGGLMSSASSQKLGKTLVVIGLVLQIVFFGLFVICAGIFHFRLKRDPTAVSTQVPWAKYLSVMYVASVLILVRSIFRIFEFLGGNDGTIMSHEFYLYIFDAVLMSGVMVCFNVVHPGGLISGRKGDMEIARDDSIILEGDGSYSASDRRFIK